MISKRAARIGLQTRVLGTVIATTGSTTLAATATGYTRASGSFLDDGFLIGMEATPAGFAANGRSVIRDVSASEIVIAGARAVEVASGSRSLTAYLPARRAHDSTLDPIAGQSSLRTEFVPATLETISMAPNNGNALETFAFFVTLYAPTDAGPDLFDVTLDAVLARLSSGTIIDAGAHTLSVMWKPGPHRGQVLPHSIAGMSYAQAVISLSAQSRTAVLP